MSLLRSALALALGGVLCVGLAQVPRDPGWQSVQEEGRLRGCMPDHLLPYTNRDPEQPGFEQAIAAAVADRLGLPLRVNWVVDPLLLQRGLRREQCDVVIGAQLMTPDMRVSINTTQAYYSTGN